MAPPANVRPGQKVPLHAQLQNARPGDTVRFDVTASGGSDVVAQVPGTLSAGTFAGDWTVNPGTRALPLSVAINAQALRKGAPVGAPVLIGTTTVDAAARISTLGWLTVIGEVLEVNEFEGVRLAAPGEQLTLKFDVDDSSGGPVPGTLALTFILQRAAVDTTTFAEVARFSDTATAVTKFERKFTTPSDDASIPGLFRIVVEGRKAGETGAVPSLGSRVSPVVKVQHFPPLILSFQVDEQSRLGSAAASAVGLHPGQKAQMFFEILGRVDEVRLSPRNIDLMPMMTLDPNPDVGARRNSGRIDDVDPTVDGTVYTLTAKNHGLEARPETVDVVSITSFSAWMQDVQPPTDLHRLTKPDGKSSVVEVRGVPAKGKKDAAGHEIDPGKPGDFSQFGTTKFLGQVSPGSNVIFGWSVLGSDLVRVEVFAGPGAKDATGKLIGRRDVTAETRAGQGAASIAFHDASPTAVLDGELVLYDDDGGSNGRVLLRTLIRLRENFPMPVLVSFHPIDVGPPRVNDPGTVEWKNLRFAWVVGGSSVNNRLKVTIKQGGVAVAEHVVKARGDDAKSGEFQPPDPALDGFLVIEARLVNDAEEVQEGKREVFVNVATPPPPPTPPVPGPPPGDPPKMEVGFNYPGSGNHFGDDFGPFIGGASRPVPVWRGTLPGNLQKISELGMQIVRFFIMGNSFNYGDKPQKVMIARTNQAIGFEWRFDPPAKLDQQYLDHFGEFLQMFKDKSMRVVPSLISFETLGPGETGGCSGRTDLVRDPTKMRHFLDTVLEKFLDVANTFKSQIFAFEVINEPAWNVRTFSKPVGRTTGGTPDVTNDQMTDFLREALKRIESRGISSTVGHRFRSDLDDFPKGTRPQFHYYAKPFAGFADPDEVPEFIDTPGAFVGEFGTVLRSEPKEPATDVVDEDHGPLWAELNGADAKPDDIVFERLKALARKGYGHAFIWPDRKKDVADVLKLTEAKQKSLVKFTLGHFPGGVP